MKSIQYSLTAKERYWFLSDVRFKYYNFKNIVTLFWWVIFCTNVNRWLLCLETKQTEIYTLYMFLFLPSGSWWPAFLTVTWSKVTFWKFESSISHCWQCIQIFQLTMFPGIISVDISCRVWRRPGMKILIGPTVFRGPRNFEPSRGIWPLPRNCRVSAEFYVILRKHGKSEATAIFRKSVLL